MTDKTFQRQKTFHAAAFIASILLLFSAAAADQPAPAGKRPNIVLILVDDLGACDLAYSGSPYHQTPHIDSLAEKGMVFTQCYASCAVCSPTRASLQTGKSPARLGLTDWIRARFQGGVQPTLVDGQWPYEKSGKNRLSCPVNPIRMELEEFTIAERLKELGYRTGYIGKWHLGTDEFFPDKQGYDVNRGGCDLGQPPSYFDPYYSTSTERNPGDEKKNPRYRITTLKPEQTGEFLTHREAREAVKFIRESGDKPFFLMLSHYAVHTPIMCPETVRQKYDQIKQERGKTNPNLLKPFDGDRDDLDERQESNEQRNPAYAGLVESVDDAVGVVLRCLVEQALEENTIVIFTSDNGGYCGVTDNFPLREGKGTPYEGGLRVPMIFYVPDALKKSPTAKSTEVPFSTCDFLPTLLDFAGRPLSEQEMQQQNLDGKNMAPFLRGETAAVENDLYWHFPHYRLEFDPYSVIRTTDGWKLIRRYTLSGAKYELYDLKSDPQERTDLSIQKPNKVKELSEKLDDWLKRTGARMPK